MYQKLICLTILVLVLRIEVIATINYSTCEHSGYEKWITVDNKTCYYLWESYLRCSWHDSNVKCKSLGGELPSIHSKLKNDLLVNMFKKYFPFYAETKHWIGLNSLAKRGSYKWSDGTAQQYTNFPINPPTGVPPLNAGDVYLQGRCVYFDNSIVKNTSYGFWYYDDCNDVHQYICEKDFSLSTAIPPTTPIPPGNCPSDWLQYANEKCIKVVDDLMTWTQANSRCRSLGGEMLSIHSEEEQNFITSLIPNKTMPYIGLIKKYSNSSWSWIDQSQVTYSDWANYKVDTHQNVDYKCAVLLTDDIQSGKWLKSQCDKNQTVICEKAKDPSITTTHPKPFLNCTIPGFIGNNFGLVQYRNSCYSMVDKQGEQRTWNNAEAACEEMNAHLLSVVDPFEYAFIMYYLTQYAKSDQFWIGFYADNSDSNVTQGFRWTDKWPNYFTKWDNNEPYFANQSVKQCVYQSKTNGTWHTADCLQKRSFICKTTLNPLPKMNINMNGSCPKLNTTDKKLLWTDIDNRSKYCYWFSSDMPNDEGLSSWTDASFHCRKRNGTLASIHSYHDLSLIKSKITRKHNTWIGLYQSPYGGFVWEDKSAVDYTNWDRDSTTREGDGFSGPTVSMDSFGDKCVKIQSSNLKWVEYKCSVRSYEYFICQIPKIYNLSVTPKTFWTSTKSQQFVSLSTLPSSSFLNSTVSPKPMNPSTGLSSGQQAGIVIGVILLTAIIAGAVIFTIKKFKLKDQSLPNFENSLYSSRRGLNGKSDGEAITSEPVVVWTKSENNVSSLPPKVPIRSKK